MYVKHKKLVQIAFLLYSEFYDHYKNHVPITYFESDKQKSVVPIVSRPERGQEKVWFGKALSKPFFPALSFEPFLSTFTFYSAAKSPVTDRQQLFWQTFWTMDF